MQQFLPIWWSIIAIYLNITSFLSFKLFFHNESYFVKFNLIFLVFLIANYHNLFEVRIIITNYYLTNFLQIFQTILRRKIQYDYDNVFIHQIFYISPKFWSFFEIKTGAFVNVNVNCPWSNCNSYSISHNDLVGLFFTCSEHGLNWWFSTFALTK